MSEHVELTAVGSSPTPPVCARGPTGFFLRTATPPAGWGLGEQASGEHRAAPLGVAVLAGRAPPQDVGSEVLSMASYVHSAADELVFSHPDVVPQSVFFEPREPQES